MFPDQVLHELFPELIAYVDGCPPFPHRARVVRLKDYSLTWMDSSRDQEVKLLLDFIIP